MTDENAKVRLAKDQAKFWDGEAERFARKLEKVS